ncbi:hypothetical protein PNP85_10430 [Halobacterium salinarum]|uniref:hypothetical protein n=1 Tax=Halobacterium salinarum TaxID=2242 RepID=UPI002553AA1E|nr:hypothetical protein [Halobacterium salinarum]MDL0139920.1 hypothetical protein [Halobacterium salinarum]
MTESSAPEDGSPVVLEALPAGALRMSHVDALNESDAIEIAAPLVIDSPTDCVTRLY